MAGQAVLGLCIFWAGSLDAQEDSLEFPRRRHGGSPRRCLTTDTKSPA